MKKMLKAVIASTGLATKAFNNIGIKADNLDTEMADQIIWIEWQGNPGSNALDASLGPEQKRRLAKSL